MRSLRALRPFAHREYRVLIAALAISIFGSGMWAVAMVYEVIQLGGGPLELSLVAAAGSVGLVAFVLAGGIAADRFPQRLLPRRPDQGSPVQSNAGSPRAHVDGDHGRCLTPRCLAAA